MWGEEPRQRYRTIIVGGGPAGISVLVRAARLNVLEELCSEVSTVGQDGAKVCGVCVLDADRADRLGGGRLQDYVINSNTNGDAFVNNVLQDRPALIPPEASQGTCLESLRPRGTGQCLLEYKGTSASLRDVGAWLRDVADTLRRKVLTLTLTLTLILFTFQPYY